MCILRAFRRVFLFCLLLLRQAGEALSERQRKAQCTVHALVAGRAADGEAGHTVFTAPCLNGLRELSRDPLPPKDRLDEKVLKYADIPAGKGRE